VSANERSATVAIRVPFHDVDPLGLVWHGHYAKYCELARCALLDSFDYGYARMMESGYAWPVIEFSLRYIQPARFDQHITVRATLQEWEHRLKIAYLVTDAATGARLTKAHTVQVAVAMPAMEMQLASPDVLRARLGIKP
jgi:acyl-CoA thioester hydrolase